MQTGTALTEKKYAVLSLLPPLPRSIAVVLEIKTLVCLPTKLCLHMQKQYKMEQKLLHDSAVRHDMALQTLCQKSILV